MGVKKFQKIFEAHLSTSEILSAHVSYIEWPSSITIYSIPDLRCCWSYSFVSSDCPPSVTLEFFLRLDFVSFLRRKFVSFHVSYMETRMDSSICEPSSYDYVSEGCLRSFAFVPLHRLVILRLQSISTSVISAISLLIYLSFPVFVCCHNVTSD